MTKLTILKGFLESIESLTKEQSEGILEAASLLFESNINPTNRQKAVNEAEQSKSFKPKETPAIDKLIAALTEKVKRDGDEKLAKLLAQASKEKNELKGTGAAKLEAESEDTLWVKNAHPDEGKMHRALNIPKGKKVTDIYTSGKELATDLLKANKGDKRKTAGQLGFVANVGKGDSVFDKALRYLPNLKGNKD